MWSSSGSLGVLFLSSTSFATAAVPSFPTFIPTRVSYQSLFDDDDVNTDAFWNALKEVGLVSITGISSAWNKQALFRELETCMLQPSIAAPLHTFSDGTRRRTLATQTLAGQAKPLFEQQQDDENQDDCRLRLERHSQAFRRVVDQVTAAVADRLGEMLQIKSNSDDIFFLLDDVDQNQHYTIDQIIHQGEHLEHFHCYYHDGVNSEDTAMPNTIDWHTDQGLMLVFSPGQQQGKATDGFYIQLKDGSAVELSLETEKDDVIVMLGDGVDQYVNPKFNEEESVLRAVPHSFKMQRTEHDDQSQYHSAPRVWYGRMVLPPPNAVHPHTAMTFQDMRTSMIDGNQDILSLGCASPHQVARELADEEETICSNTTSSFCWHQCMNFTDFEDVSPEDCESRSLSVGCVNDEGLLWIDEIHDPAFQLGCVNLSVAGKNVLLEKH